MSRTDVAAVREARYRAMADPVRRRLLRLLEDSESPRDVEGLSEAVGLHPNTVRGHLEILEAAGLVEETLQPRQTPGRPRLLYSRSEGSSDASAGGYRLLAEMLTTTIKSISDEPADAAEKAGRQWGHYLSERLPPLQALPPEESVRRIGELLDDIGFEPRSRHDDDSTVFDLVDCPFRELAREHGDVICSLHLGMLEGAAEALGDTTYIEALQPFVEPSLCRAIVRPRSDG